MKLQPGQRTLAFGLVCVLAIVALFSLTPPKDRGQVFAFAVGAIVGLMGALATKSAVGTLAGGDGIKGALTNLMTDKKPGEP
jgi:hypothetical protein